MQKKKGVSLIVLVITIIVMVILAGTIIMALDNAGIIERSENAVGQYNIAELKRFANVAWGEAYMSGARTEEDLTAGVMAILEKSKITEDKYEGYRINVTTKGATIDEIEIIPEGGMYYVGAQKTQPGNYTGAKETYTVGDEFPAKVNDGDIYTYGSYEYIYITEEVTGEKGWKVSVLSTTQSEYEPVLAKINGKPLVSMEYLFGTSEWEPVFTNSWLSADFVIPQGVKNVSGMFKTSAINIKTLPLIPEGVVDVSSMFADSGVYEGKITKDYKLPSTVKNASGMFLFLGTTALPEDFLNEGVENIDDMFNSGGFPNNFIVPSSVKSMNGTFAAASENRKVIINANPTEYEGCFGGLDMSTITLAGKCSRELKQLIANTGENGSSVTITD